MRKGARPHDFSLAGSPIRVIVSPLSGILLGLMLLTGCAGKDKVSSGIIPIDKMKTIVWDMVQADVYTDLYMKKDSSRMARLETLQLYAQVLELHQVSREDFRKSFQYYSERPDLSRELFDSVQSLGARDRATHPPSAPPRTVPVQGKGVAPDRVVPNIPVVHPAFSFPGRVPHNISPNGIPGSHPAPGSHPPIPSSHPVPGVHAPAPNPAPGTTIHSPGDSSAHRIHAPSAHPAADTSTRHHRAPAISKPSTKDII